MHVNQSGRATTSSSSISQNGTLTLIFLLSYHHHGSCRPPFTAIHGSRRQHLHQSRQSPSQPPSDSIANLQPLKPSTPPHSSATTAQPWQQVHALRIIQSTAPFVIHTTQQQQPRTCNSSVATTTLCSTAFAPR